ncbi:MAG: response regulator [Patescibacteria group bacterium]
MIKKSVLIIEDEKDILDLYKEYLTSVGFEVDTASDGEEGLKKIVGGKSALVLLDIMMPKLDGIGVLQSIKEQESKLPTTIMLTNLSHDQALKDAINLGAKDFIIKSETTPDQVVEKINKYLK